MGKSRHGVWQKTLFPTRIISRANLNWFSSLPTCSMAEFENVRSKDLSWYGSSHPDPSTHSNPPVSFGNSMLRIVIPLLRPTRGHVSGAPPTSKMVWQDPYSERKFLYLRLRKYLRTGIWKAIGSID